MEKGENFPKRVTFSTLAKSCFCKSNFRNFGGDSFGPYRDFVGLPVGHSGSARYGWRALEAGYNLESTTE